MQLPQRRDPRLQGLFGQFNPEIPHGSPLDPAPDPRLSDLQGTFAPHALQSPPQPLPAPTAPMAQPVPMQAPTAPQGHPQAPPATIDRKRYRPFDKANRQDALLAIGTGLLSHPESFSAGIGAAGENLGQLRRGYDTLQRKSVTTGGPDDAFQITTDPVTGQRTYEPIAPVQGYLKDKAAALRAPKAPNAGDNVKMRGKTMAAILQLPPAQQAQAYSDFRADSVRLGYDLGLPPEWNPDVASAMAGQTVSPTERMTDARARAAGDRATTAGNRTQANADRNYALATKRQGLAERKFAAPPSTRKSAAKPSGNSDLDYLK